MSDGSIDLNKLVVAIRSGLEQADLESRNAGKDALFELDSLELELKFLVAEQAGMKGRFDLKIVSFGTSDDVKTEQVQTIKVKYAVSKDALRTGVPGTRAHAESADDAAQDVDPL